MEAARPKELRALQELEDSELSVEASLRIYKTERNHGIAHGLYFELHPPETTDDVAADDIQGVIEEFWSPWLGDNWEAFVEDPAFAAGFCEGALKVWSRVASKI